MISKLDLVESMITKTSRQSSATTKVIIDAIDLWNNDNIIPNSDIAKIRMTAIFRCKGNFV